MDLRDAGKIFYFIGNISGGFGRMDAADPIAVSIAPDAGFLASEFTHRLEQRNFRVIEDPNYFRLIRIPSGFTDSVLAGKPVKPNTSGTAPASTAHTRKPVSSAR